MSKVPLSLALQQGTMIKTLGRMAISTLLPNRQQQNPSEFQPAQMVVPALSDKLVSHYIRWSGAEGRYQNELPPHMFSQWALPVASQIIGQSRYDIAGVINQGADMVVNAPLPRGEDINVSARLLSLKEENNRARLSIEIISGTAKSPNAVVAQMHVTFILGPKTHKNESQKTSEPNWETVGHWQTNARDGLNFALLTGDFNPIHWIGLAGKLSPFKSKVLHGFGMFVRTYESLAEQGAIREIGLRFLKPVPLPSAQLDVQEAEADSDGRQPIRLIGPDGALHLAGHLYRK